MRSRISGSHRRGICKCQYGRGRRRINSLSRGRKMRPPELNDISNVTLPTMTVYSPTGKNTGAAVFVFPGGGYEDLAIVLEGTEVCDWLITKGITCVLLKYRVTAVGPYPRSGPYPESPMALEDTKESGRCEQCAMQPSEQHWRTVQRGQLVALARIIENVAGYSPADGALRAACDQRLAFIVRTLTIRVPTVLDMADANRSSELQYPDVYSSALILNLSASRSQLRRCRDSGR